MGTFEESNIERIKSIAIDVRVKHKAMDWNIPPVYLINKEGLDYGQYDLTESTFTQKFLRFGKTIINKIKAVIFVREKTVLIDCSLHDSKKPFGKAHELGHHSIP